MKLVKEELNNFERSDDTFKNLQIGKQVMIEKIINIVKESIEYSLYTKCFETVDGPGAEIQGFDDFYEKLNEELNKNLF